MEDEHAPPLRFTEKTWQAIVGVLWDADSERDRNECSEGAKVDIFFDTCVAVTREHANGNSQERVFASEEEEEEEEEDEEAKDNELYAMSYVPHDVIRGMCKDMADLVDKGQEGGALKMLRMIGLWDAVTALMYEEHPFKWKCALFKRAIREFLTETDEHAKWQSLVLGSERTKRWLTRNFGEVMGHPPFHCDLAKFLVNQLF
jgi:hypothetical protein